MQPFPPPLHGMQLRPGAMGDHAPVESLLLALHVWGYALPWGWMAHSDVTPNCTRQSCAERTAV